MVNSNVAGRSTDMAQIQNTLLSVAQLGVSAATASEPPWPDPSGVSYWEWERFGRYSNYIAAQIVAGRLEMEGVPAIVEAIGAFPGTDCSAIWVPKKLLHRACWILAWSPPTDAELTFLATGELLS